MCILKFAGLESSMGLGVADWTAINVSASHPTVHTLVHTLCKFFVVVKIIEVHGVVHLEIARVVDHGRQQLLF